MSKFTVSMTNIAGPLGGQEPIGDGGQREVCDNLAEAQLLAEKVKTNWDFVTVREVDETDYSVIKMQYIKGKRK